MRGPACTGAGPVLAATAATEKRGDRAKTAYGASASLNTVPDAPRTTATLMRPLDALGASTAESAAGLWTGMGLLRCCACADGAVLVLRCATSRGNGTDRMAGSRVRSPAR